MTPPCSNLDLFRATFIDTGSNLAVVTFPNPVSGVSVTGGQPDLGLAQQLGLIADMSTCHYFSVPALAKLTAGDILFLLLLIDR